jgi:glycosyltransferase involved in cell wall biosynthesis
MGTLTIGFDVTPTITGTTGIARYAHELPAALSTCPDPPEVRRFAVGRASVPVGPDVAHNGIPLRIIDRSWRLGGPPSVERMVGPVDTVHAAGPALPTTRAPIVAVVYDLATLDHPELHPPRDVAQLRRYLARIHRAAAVVTISQATADRLSAEVSGVPIHVTAIGRTPLPAPVASPLAGRPYVLAVARPVARKGFDTLVRAMAHVGADVQLVIVGAIGPIDPALDQLAHEVGLSDRYHRPSSVSDAELAGWYASAAAVTVPSLEEGFSLPVVEAQSVEVPVVVSDIPVHREVAGTAAWFVAPGDVDGLTGALKEVLAGGQAVSNTATAGPANAARYTWEACARATLAVHRSVG